MKKKLLAALLVLSPLCVQATPVIWTLQDVLVGPFDNTPIGGSPLTGSFTYDADFGLYSNINITSQNGIAISCVAGPPVTCDPMLTTFSGQHYDTAVNTSPFSTANSLVGINGPLAANGLSGDPLLYLKFAANLTNAGGSVDFVKGGVEYICPDASCKFNFGVFRSVAYGDGIDAAGNVYQPYFGRITATAVSEPATIALFGFSALLLAFRNRKGKR